METFLGLPAMRPSGSLVVQDAASGTPCAPEEASLGLTGSPQVPFLPNFWMVR
jgi:hypothetical protein